MVLRTKKRGRVTLFAARLISAGSSAAIPGSTRIHPLDPPPPDLTAAPANFVTASRIMPVQERIFGLKNRRGCLGLGGGEYAEMNITDAIDNLSRNPLDHWSQAYLRYTRFSGGDKIRNVISSVLTTTGVVSALLSSLILTALSSPPTCDLTPAGFNCNIMHGLFEAYGAINIFNLLCCVTTITYVTIANMWIGVHRDEEMVYYIQEYYFYAIAFPTTTMSFAIVGVIIGEMIRVWIIYGKIAFWIGVGTAVCIAVPCMWFATKIVFVSIAMRKAQEKWSVENPGAELKERV
jgi:hypothetical protein